MMRLKYFSSFVICEPSYIATSAYLERDYIVIISDSLLTTFCYSKKRMENIFHILCNKHRRLKMMKEENTTSDAAFLRGHAENEAKQKK